MGIKPWEFDGLTLHDIAGLAAAFAWMHGTNTTPTVPVNRRIDELWNRLQARGTT